MVVGTAQIRLAIRDARSLKDKRRVVASLKDRLRNSFNVSVAEVDGLDLIQSATIGVVQVSNDSRYVSGSLGKLIEAVRKFPAAQLVDYRIEIL